MKYTKKQQKEHMLNYLKWLKNEIEKAIKVTESFR